MSSNYAHKHWYAVMRTHKFQGWSVIYAFPSEETRDAYVAGETEGLEVRYAAKRCYARGILYKNQFVLHGNVYKASDKKAEKHLAEVNLPEGACKHVIRL